jgi:hypothetical protein
LKTKPNKVFTSLPIIISLLALGVSIYSVKLSSESHYIKKTETMVGKRYEILSLMKQLIDLKRKEYELVQKIVWTYEDNPKLLDREKDRYSHWKKEYDKIRDEIDEEQEMRGKFLKDKKNDNIVLLENYVGYYKLMVSFAVSDNDRAKEYLDELGKRLLKAGLDIPNKAKETKQKSKATADSPR